MGACVSPNGPIASKKRLLPCGRPRPLRALGGTRGVDAKKNQLACLWAKGEENARRIALIIAAGEDSNTSKISAANADYTTRLIRYLLFDFEKRVVPEIVAGELDSRKRRLVSIIEKKGEEGCDKRYLTRASQWANQKQRNDLIADLVEAGEIITELDTAGRPKFWTAENFIKKNET